MIEGGRSHVEGLLSSLVLSIIHEHHHLIKSGHKFNKYCERESRLVAKALSTAVSNFMADYNDGSFVEALFKEWWKLGLPVPSHPYSYQTDTARLFNRAIRARIMRCFRTIYGDSGDIDFGWFV